MTKLKDFALRVYLAAKDYTERYPVPAAFAAGFVAGALIL